MSVMQVGKWARGVALPPDWWVPKADGRTLDLNLSLGQIWDSEHGARPMAALSVSRLSERSRRGPAGRIEMLGSGRIGVDHTPAGVPLGVRADQTSAQLLQYTSERGNAYWTKGAASISEDAATGPDGLSTADKLVENTATDGFHFISRALTKGASANTYTYAEIVKAAGRSYVGLSAFSGSNGVGVTANLGAGTIGAAGAYGSGWVAGAASIEDAGDGFYLVRMTFTTGTETTVSVQLSLRTASTNVYTGDGTSGVYLGGCQLEVGNIPTSHMPAGASTTTRYADVISEPWGAWGNDDEGTFRAVYRVPYLSSGAREVFSVGDGSGAGEQMFLRATSGANNIGWFDIGTGGAETGRIEAGAAVAGQREVVAVSYGAAGFKISRNGGAVATNAALTPPTAPDTLYIGRGMNGFELGGWIERLTYWPEEASNAALQARSAA